MLNTSKNYTDIITPHMESWMKGIEQDLAVGKNIIGPFTSSFEMDKFLYSVLKNEPQSNATKAIDPLS
ncbi:MAG: hypothetical protein HYZ51_02495 [Candidatus Doudnabacteria bacterium]|nr:hypothetical protein [Candidatus Doudnabacteria bacterium]